MVIKRNRNWLQPPYPGSLTIPLLWERPEHTQKGKRRGERCNLKTNRQTKSPPQNRQSPVQQSERVSENGQEKNGAQVVKKGVKSREKGKLPDKKKRPSLPDETTSTHRLRTRIKGRADGKDRRGGKKKGGEDKG